MFLSQRGFHGFSWIFTKPSQNLSKVCWISANYANCEQIYAEFRKSRKCRENEVKNSIFLFIARNLRPGLSFFPAQACPNAESSKSMYFADQMMQKVMIADYEAPENALT